MPQRYRDLSKQKFGRLKALEHLGERDGETMWLCVCDCGNRVDVRKKSLLRGNTRSCGCLAGRSPSTPKE